MAKITSVDRHIRFSPGQYRLIENKACQLGMTFSEFVRVAALRASHAEDKYEPLEALTNAARP